MILDRLVRDDGAEFIWILNQTEQRLTVAPVIEDGGRLTGLDDEVPQARIDIEPLGVRVLRLLA